MRLLIISFKKKNLPTVLKYVMLSFQYCNFQKNFYNITIHKFLIVCLQINMLSSLTSRDEIFIQFQLFFLQSNYS